MEIKIVYDIYFTLKPHYLGTLLGIIHILLQNIQYKKRMEIKKKLSVYVLYLFACTFFFTGCKKDVYDPNKNEPKVDGFDYATRSVKTLDIDYGIEGYKAVFEIYTENPIVTENGVSKKKEGVKSSFKTYTNEDCQYTGSINLPTATDKVYLYSENIGLPQCVEVEVGENGIKFNLEEYIEKRQSSDAQPTALLAKSVLSARAKGANPYNISTPLGGWNQQGADNWRGIPDYLIKKTGNKGQLIPIIGNIPDKLIDRITSTLKGNDNSAYAKSSDIVNIKVVKDASINLIFLDGKGEYHNAMGYYYYDSGRELTPEEFKALPKYIAFPNCTEYSRGGGALNAGNRIKLMYYGKKGEDKGSETFPKGITIGWFLLAKGFENDGYATVNYDPEKGTWFSNNEFNTGKIKSCISIYDTQSKTTVLGIEDGGDKDYKDILFYVEATPSEAIYDPDKPIIDDPEIENPPLVSDPVEGTLAFEDLWPNQGDYDMNDVVVTYQRSCTVDNKGNIIGLKDIYTPVHKGGQIKSGFGYQIGVPTTGVSNVQIENGGVKSEGIINGMEFGQKNATFILFDDMEQAVKNGAITITLEINGLTLEDMQKDLHFYNPFIRVSPNKEGKNPIQEIHLTNYPPTDLADLTYFGRYKDHSSLDEEGNPIGPYYYVSEDEYPFAIDLPIMDYKVPTEAMRIDLFYPKFKNWVKTKGQEDADWYKHPIE